MAENGRKKDDTRHAGTRPLAALIPGLARRAVGKRGFTDARILNEWPQIVGEDLARHAHPDRLSFPRGRRDAGTLHIRAEGPMATELQHLERIVVERINAHFGYRAVAGIRLLQTPPARRPKKAVAARKPLLPADPERLSNLHARLEAVEDPDMRAVLERIGESVLRREAARKQD